MLADSVSTTDLDFDLSNVLSLLLGIQVFLYANEVNYANTAMNNLYVKGLQEGDAQKVRQLPPFFIAATAFLKLWIVACYESQSFVGLSNGRSILGEQTGADINRLCLISVCPLAGMSQEIC